MQHTEDSTAALIPILLRFMSFSWPVEDSNITDSISVTLPRLDDALQLIRVRSYGIMQLDREGCVFQQQCDPFDAGLATQSGCEPLFAASSEERIDRDLQHHSDVFQAVENRAFLRFLILLACLHQAL